MGRRILIERDQGFWTNDHVGEMESVFSLTIIEESKVVAANALCASSPPGLPSAEPRVPARSKP